MKQSTSLFLIVIAILLLTTPVMAQKIIVAGSGDSQQLLRLLARDFNAKNPSTEVVVPESIGSSGAVKAVATGLADLGRIARPLKGKELKYGLHYCEFALSPVVFVVNNNLKGITDLTTSQVLAIFGGETTNWKELGGPDAPILVANRERGDSSRSVIEKQIPGFRDLKLAGKTLYSTPETLDILSRYDNTVGFLPLAMVDHSRLTALSFNGVTSSAQNVRSGSYPLTTPFGIIWKDGAPEAAMRFIDAIFSVSGRETIRSLGLIPLAGVKP